MKHNISQTGTDNILQSTDVLIEHHLQSNKEQVKSRLVDVGIDQTVIDDIPIETYIDDLNTADKRYYYYK